MLTPRYIIGFTGHRSGIDEAVVRSALNDALVGFQELAAKNSGRAELYSSVAEGSDTLCVETARQLNMPVHILLPMDELEFASDFTSAEAWLRSNRQIERARQRPCRDSVHQAPGETERPDCYFNQGMHILSAADILVAVWDGLPARGLGGTAEVVEQAIAIGIPVLQIDPRTGAVSMIGEISSNFAPDPVIAQLNRLESQRMTERISASDPDSLQTRLDKIAMEEASRFRPSLVRIILLHGTAALLAAVVTLNIADTHAWWEHNKWAITATELILVTLALWLGISLHRRHTLEIWIRSRIACELVRSLRASVPLIDPLHPHIIRHDPKWRRFAVSAGLFVLEHRSTVNPVMLRDAYLESRLGESHPESQITHYRTKQPVAARWWNFTGFVGAWSARLAPVFVLLSLLNKLSKFCWPQEGWKLDKHPAGWTMVVLLPIALPLVAGIAAGIRQALDAGRRKQRYLEMVARLMEIRTWLHGLKTPYTIRAAVMNAEVILLDELMEWRLAAETTSSH